MENDSMIPVAGRRRRTVGFPVIPLDEAAALTTRIGHAEGRSFSKSALAGHLGLRTTNSGVFLQKLAALRSWGLLQTVEGETLELTELGRTIALGDDPTDRVNALRQAFFDCEIFTRVYDATAKGRPTDVESLANRGVLEFGVSPQRKREFAHALVTSAIAAGVAEELDSGRIEFAPAIGDQPVTPLPGDSEGAPPGGVGRRRGSEAPAARPDRVVHQTWPFEGGELVIEILRDRPLPAAAFSKVGAVFSAIEDLVGALQESRS